MAFKLINSALVDRVPLPLRAPLRYALAAGLAMALATLFMSNTYKSEARILPADNRGSGGYSQMASAAAAVGVSIPGQDSSDAAYVDIINSRWMRKTLLEQTYRFSYRPFYLGPKRTREQTLQAFLGSRSTDRAVAAVGKLLRVNRDVKTKLISVTAETSSPELSQQLVQGVVKALDTFVQHKAQSRGGNKAAFAQQRLIEAQKAFELAEKQSLEFLEGHRNYATSNDPAVRLVGMRLENSLKLRQQVVTTLTINLEQALLEQKNDMPILNVLDEGDLPQEKNGPSRTMYVLATMALAFVVAWAVLNRPKPAPAA